MEPINKEKKIEKISKTQKEKLVEYMTNNLEFARGQFGGINSNINCKEKWENLAATLNCMGGSQKTIEQWKKCWLDLKGGVKKHINSRRSFINKTGGGSWNDVPRDLNALEEQILQVITVDAVDGDSRTPESGLKLEESSDESQYSIVILDVEEVFQPIIKKRKATLPSSNQPPSMKKLIIPTTTNASKYTEALNEARDMQMTK